MTKPLYTLPREEGIAFSNEIHRIIVGLPHDTSAYGTMMYIGVAMDANEAGFAIARAITPRSKRLPFLARHEMIATLCRDRARKTVDGSLMVDGQPIEPEQYLTMWRNACHQPMDMDDFAYQWGYAAVALFDAPVAALRGSDPGSVMPGSPFRCFDDFEARYGAQMRYFDAGNRFNLEIDLRHRTGPRHAYLLDWLMSGISDSADVEIALTLRPVSSSDPAGPNRMAPMNQQPAMEKEAA